MKSSALCIGLLALLNNTCALATDSTTDTDGNITEQHARYCIQLNKDMNLASRQMLDTEMSKASFKSKIEFLQNEIKRHRDLINKLDRQNDQSNNENYNQLVDKFEKLLEERKENIVYYEDQHQLQVTQHNSVVRLEQRFSSQCFQQIKITDELHKNLCSDEDIRWCKAFNFN